MARSWAVSEDVVYVTYSSLLPGPHIYKYEFHIYIESNVQLESSILNLLSFSSAIINLFINK